MSRLTRRSADAASLRSAARVKRENYQNAKTPTPQPARGHPGGASPSSEELGRIPKRAVFRASVVVPGEPSTGETLR